MTQVKRIKEFRARLPEALSTDSKALLTREFIVNKKDFSYAVNEAYEQGIQIAVDKAEASK